MIAVIAFTCSVSGQSGFPSQLAASMLTFDHCSVTGNPMKLLASDGLFGHRSKLPGCVYSAPVESLTVT